MNKFIMYISWIDAKIVSQTLTSIQNAYQYSTVPTEFILMLNEQTFIDTPLEKTPEQQWEYFLNHPFIQNCQIIKKTNDDDFWGVAKFRREFLNKDGLTYWGESDCMLPLEYFYVAENLDKQLKSKDSWVLSFAIRKMWEGWEMLEHPIVQKYTSHENLPKASFSWKCNGSFGENADERLENLYKFNESQGNPEIILLPQPRIEGALTILKNMPSDIICPDIDFFHEDYNLELMMKYYGIPQYHVKNIIKGHDNANSDKRSNIAGKSEDGLWHERSNLAEERKNQNFKKMMEYVQNKFNSTR